MAYRASHPIVAECVDYESGAKNDRAQFQQMLTDAARRHFDLVLFWALDRLSHEAVYKTLQYLNRLESGVGFRSSTEPFSTRAASAAASWATTAATPGLAR